MRLVVAAAAGTAALVVIAPASAALDYTTVARGAHAGEAPARAYLVWTRKDARPLAGHLPAADRARLAAVDYRRFAVVAATVSVPTPCHALRIRAIERTSRVLVVSAGVRETDKGACIQVIARAYHVVKVRKAALGSGPRRHAVLRLRGA